MAMIIKPKRKFTAGAPTTSDIAEGEIAINTADKKLYVRDNSNNIVEIGGGGSASGATTDVTQSSHGFAVKDCIRHTGSAWTKARANSNSTLALGVVTAVANSNTFTVAQSGRFELTSHGLTVGQWYYLSESSAGALTTTEPAISQPLVYVESANFLFVFPYRPTNLLVAGQVPLGIHVDEFTGNGSTAAYTLGADPLSEDNTQVYINGVYQEKSTYAVSGTTLTFDTNITNGSSIEVVRYAASAVVVNVVDDNTVTTAKLATDAVTQAKIADEAIDEARMQISNAGSNGEFLSKQSGNTGGLTWAAVSTTPADGSISTAKLADDAVTAAKIADDAVVQAAIADDAVDEARIQISNAGSNGQFLSKQSGNTGGLTWAAAGIDGWSSSSNNLLPASASSGIYLGVNSATAANLLDDYEEGTFTPAFQPSSGSFTSVSYSYQDGWYTKVGRLVTFQIAIAPTGSNHGSASGNLYLGGLPFTCLNEQSGNSSGSVDIGYSKYWNNNNAHFGSVSAGNTYISFQPASGFDGWPISNLKTSGASWLYCGGSYYTA